MSLLAAITGTSFYLIYAIFTLLLYVSDWPMCKGPIVAYLYTRQNKTLYTFVFFYFLKGICPKQTISTISRLLSFSLQKHAVVKKNRQSIKRSISKSPKSYIFAFFLPRYETQFRIFFFFHFTIVLLARIL